MAATEFADGIKVEMQPTGRYLFLAAHGGVSINSPSVGDPFIVNGRATTQQFQVGQTAIYILARLATADDDLIDTQTIVNFTPSDWADGKSRDLPSTLAFRADGNGSTFFIVDMPGNEPYRLHQEGRIEVRQWHDAQAIEVRDNATDRLKASFGPTFLLLGASSLPPATQAERGQVRRVEGGPGDSDQIYLCIKDVDDTYEWRQI